LIRAGFVTNVLALSERSLSMYGYAVYLTLP
jgi:hypothetical protein